MGFTLALETLERVFERVIISNKSMLQLKLLMSPEAYANRGISEVQAVFRKGRMCSVDSPYLLPSMSFLFVASCVVRKGIQREALNLLGQELMGALWLCSFLLDAVRIIAGRDGDGTAYKELLLSTFKKAAC